MEEELCAIEDNHT
jgi:hypothetical protein